MINPANATVTQSAITLDGTQSTSATGKPLTYFWSIAQGSLPAAISQGTTATPIVSFGAGDGTYAIVLTVTDSAGATSTASTTLSFFGQ